MVQNVISILCVTLTLTFDLFCLVKDSEAYTHSPILQPNYVRIRIKMCMLQYIDHFRIFTREKHVFRHNVVK